MSSISTLYHSTSATPSASHINQVLSDLIPVSRKSITISYELKTKNWVCMFDRQRFQSLYDNDKETHLIIELQIYMINIQKELKTIGYENSCQIIVNFLLICDPVTNQYPKSFTDVMKIIENTFSYNKNVMKSRNILWMALYGVFRQNLYRWLENLAHKWKLIKKIEKFTLQNRSQVLDLYSRI